MSSWLIVQLTLSGNSAFPDVWTCSCTACRSHPRSSVHLRTANSARLFQTTVENLQLAYELARRNLIERADKQAVVNETLSFPSFKTGEQVLIHRPYNETDGPNPKLISPWRGPYTARAQKSPVIYRVTKDSNTAEITVHLGRIKKYVVPPSSPVPDLDALDDIFLGTTLPCPILKAPSQKL